jgi:hypothetical protein
MDAIAACAMWEEANMVLHGQMIILRYLSDYFGCQLTIPESKIREPERGALPPNNTGSVEINEKPFISSIRSSMM